MKMMVMKMLTVMHQEHCTPWLPFFLGYVELVDAPQANFPPPCQLSSMVSKSGFCAQEAQLGTGKGHICTLNMYQVLGLALASLMEAEDWKNLSEDCWQSCAEIQAILATCLGIGLSTMS